MNKITLTTLATLLTVSSGNVALAHENLHRGEAADPADSMPRDDQEDLPFDNSHPNSIAPKPAMNPPSPTGRAAPPLTDTAFDQGFIEDSHLQLNFRNQYVNRHYQHRNASRLIPPTGWRQWAQGLSIDYMSGYAYGIFGIDASLYGGIKLDGNNPQNAHDELLHTEKGNSRYSNFYSRIGRLNAKVRLGDAQNNAVFRYGMIGVKTALLADSDSRLFESSYRGASADAVFDELNGLRLYGFYLDRIGFRTGNSYDRFQSSRDGQTIDNIQIYGAGYTINDIGGADDYLYLNGEYGVSKDYVKQYFGQASYHFAIGEDKSLLTNLQYRQGKKAGKLWNTHADGFDKEANHINANIMSVINGFEMALSYSYTNAKNNKTAEGTDSHQFKPLLAANDYGKGTYWTSRQISNFNYDKESAYQAMVGYDFTHCGIAGLGAKLTHTYGTGINKAVGLENEQETDLNLSYSFQQAELKGLSLQLEHAWYVSRNITGSTVTAGKRLRDLRVYANYNLAVF